MLGYDAINIIIFMLFVVFSQHDISEHEISQTTPVVLHSSTAVRYPPFLMSALEKEDPQLKAPTKNKFKNSLIQALFDHLSQKTM